MCNTQLSIDLHPSKLRDVLGSVRDQLNGLLLKYRADLSGVVLTYRDERILNETALVHGFFPYFHIDVSAKLQILKLHVGQSLGKYTLSVLAIAAAWKHEVLAIAQICARVKSRHLRRGVLCSRDCE